jgi:hypothetical protein
METNPDSGVAQDDVQKVVGFLSQPQGQGEGAEPPKEPVQNQPPEVKTAEQPTDQASEELTPDDLEVEQQPTQSAGDAFEIVHNGQQVKLSREETIKYAMQGFDYTQKTQALANKDKQVAQQLQALSQIQQVHPQLIQKQAQLEAIKSNLSQWQGVNWVKLATEDPLGYAPARAQYDQLVQEFQRAHGDFEQTQAAVNQHVQGVRAQRAQAEYEILPKLVPEWADQSKRAAGESMVAKHYAETYGVGPDELGASLGGSALALATAYKAMKYDQLLKGKAEKVKQLRSAPPMTRPGAATSPDMAKANKDKELNTRFRKSGTVEDAAALLLNRMK